MDSSPVIEPHAIGSSQTITFTPVSTVYLPILFKSDNTSTSTPSATPTSTGNSTITPTSTGDLTATPTSTGDLTATPTSTGDSTATPTVTLVTQSEVRITYIEYKPTVTKTGEYLLIENFGSSSVNMTGWTLRDAVPTTFTFPIYMLQARSVVTIWVYTGTNDAQNLYWGRTQDVWNNSGDTAILSDAQGKEIHRFTYPTATPTPTITPTPSGTITPTVTATPIVITSTIAITITEVKFTPTEQEHVKIQNNESSAIDMSGWTLYDAGSYKFTFPNGFTLQPSAVVTVWVITGTNDAQNLYSGLKSSVWNDDGDTAILMNKSGMVVATYVYPTNSPTPTSTPVGTPTATPTAYPVGSSPATATVRITYIEFDPVGDDLDGEHVLIKNFGDLPLEMTGWTLSDEKNSSYKFLTFTLQSQNVVTVWIKVGTNDAGNLYWNDSRSIWNNDGDTALLKDKSGKLIHRCTYDQNSKNSVDCEVILK